jgi:hypothetical protein
MNTRRVVGCPFISSSPSSESRTHRQVFSYIGLMVAFGPWIACLSEMAEAGVIVVTALVDKKSRRVVVIAAP